MKDAWIKSISEKRGAPYIYFDGQQALRAGFSPGEKYDLQIGEDRVVLTVSNDGSRTVSARTRASGVYPVLDINSKALLQLFEGMQSIRVIAQEGRITLLPLASEVKKRERFKRISSKLEEGAALYLGSISHGGGILSHAIHKGLEEAGFKADLKFANEIREDLLLQAIEHNDAWNPETQALALPMQELAQDEWLLNNLPKLDVLEMGLPCSGASRAGASKRGLDMMESHPEVGHLAFSALVILSKVQPAVVLLENVPEYAKTASAEILRNQLRDMGYKTHEAILSGQDFGCLENRVRWCMVGTTAGLDFDFEHLAPIVHVVKKLGDCLDPLIGPDDPRYRAVNYLKEKMVRDAAKGNSFSMQMVTEDSVSVPTIRKGYAKGGSTDPRLKHPSDPNLSRLLTAREHAAVKEVPDHLIEGMSETTAHQLLGQGIVYAPFEAVGRRIGECLQKLAEALQQKQAIEVSETEAPRRRRSFGVG